MNTQQKRDYIDTFYGAPLSSLSDALRGFLISKRGHDLIAADFSNIEGRVLAWLAGEDWKIKAFEAFDAKLGPDLYKLSAARIYNCAIQDVDNKRRQVGKVAELALGYQGGVGAFQTMAKGYGVKVNEKDAEEIKTKWRELHPKTVSYWYELERAAVAAVRDAGKVYLAGHENRRVRYRTQGSFLFCKLPSGRVITYPYPKIKTVTTPWGADKEAIVYKGLVNNQWVDCTLYGGLLAENCTQAVARDILAEALKRVEQQGYPVVIHVHDECVSEIPEGFGSTSEYGKIVCERPAWCKDLPIVTGEIWRGKRYRK